MSRSAISTRDPGTATARNVRRCGTRKNIGFGGYPRQPKPEITASICADTCRLRVNLDRCPQRTFRRMFRYASSSDHSVDRTETTRWPEPVILDGESFNSRRYRQFQIKARAHALNAKIPLQDRGPRLDLAGRPFV